MFASITLSESAARAGGPSELSLGQAFALAMLCGLMVALAVLIARRADRIEHALERERCEGCSDAERAQRQGGTPR